MAVYTLGALVEQVDEILDVIKKLEQAMRHAHPASVDIMRKNKEQLEKLLEYIMESDITSFVNLEQLLIGSRRCLSECMNQMYTDKKSYIGKTRSYT